MIQLHQYFKNIFLTIIIILSGQAIAAGFDDSKINSINYPKWFINDPFYELKEALDSGIANSKKGLMVVFSTEGCSYCYKFIQESLNNPDIAADVKKHFISYAIELFDDADLVDPKGKSMRVDQFAKKHNVQFTPTLLFFDNNGKRVFRMTGYPPPDRFKNILAYVKAERYKTEKFRTFITRQTVKSDAKAEYISLKTDPLFSKPPYILDRRYFSSSKPLLILFERKGCQDCSEYHANVMADKNVRNMLEKFEIVRLDADDKNTDIMGLDGKHITPAKWFENEDFSHVPAMVFYNEKGLQILKTDALVSKQRMMNAMSLVLERAYEKGWSYQKMARTKAIERAQKQKKAKTDNLQLTK